MVEIKILIRSKKKSEQFEMLAKAFSGILKIMSTPKTCLEGRRGGMVSSKKGPWIMSYTVKR